MRQQGQAERLLHIHRHRSINLQVTLKLLIDTNSAFFVTPCVSKSLQYTWTPGPPPMAPDWRVYLSYPGECSARGARGARRGLPPVFFGDPPPAGTNAFVSTVFCDTPLPSANNCLFWMFLSNIVQLSPLSREILHEHHLS